MPGVSHTYGGTDADESAVSTILANLTSAAGVVPPVSASLPWIETPLLHGPEGSVLAVLNWTDHGYDVTGSNNWNEHAYTNVNRRKRKMQGWGGGDGTIDVNITLGYEPASATSVKLGELTMIQIGAGSVNIKLKLGAADFVLFRKKGAT
jgi:hypothetical protein